MTADDNDVKPQKGSVARTRPANNAAYLAIANLGSKVFSLFFVLYAVRTLGSGLYGNFADVNSLVGLFAFVTDMGLSTLAVRDVGRDHSQAARYISNVLVLRLILSAADIVAIVVLTRLTVGQLVAPALHNAVYVYALSLAPLAVSSTLQLVFQFSERMEYSAIFNIVTSIVRVALSIVVLMMGHRVLALMIVFTGVTALSTVIMAWVVYTRFLPPRLEINPGWWPVLLRRSAPFVMLTLLNVVYYRADMQILYVLSGCAGVHDNSGCRPVGQYSAAYQVLDVLQLIFVTSSQAATFPAFSRVAAESRDALLRVVSSSITLMLVLGVPISLLGTFFAPEALHVLAGQKYAQYEAAIPALAVLVWALPVLLVLSTLYNALWAVNRQGVVTWIFAVTLVFNIGLNILLIPRYSFMASSVLTVASELLNGILILGPVLRYVGPLPLWRPLLLVGAITAVTAVLLWLLRPYGIFIGLPFALLVYMFGIRLTHVMGSVEREILQRLPLLGRYAGLVV